MMRLMLTRTMSTNRNVKFTPEVQQKIIDCIKGGNFRVTAAKVAGITEKTLSIWMNNSDKKYADFQKKVIEAEAQVESVVVSKLIDAGEKDARWYAWWLERKFKRWNSAVHRWELQLLQKQLKELKNVINTLSQASQGNTAISATSPEFEEDLTEADTEGHKSLCQKQGLQSDS